MHQRFQRHRSPSCLNTGDDRLVTHKTCRSYAGARFERVVTILGRRRSFIQNGKGSKGDQSSFTEDNFDMYECVFRSRRHGDEGLVASELSISALQRGRQSRRFREGKLVLLLLGCALCACADDSTANSTRHRQHRHGGGHGRQQSETVDRSGN
jgi:hypothetical protein